MSLIVKNISYEYVINDSTISDISFEAQNGHVVTILGPNGAGKTTLMKVLLGLLKGKKGSVEFDGEEITSLSSKEKANLISYVPQNFEFSSSTVFDAIMLGRIPYITWKPTKEDMDVVSNLILEFNLSDYATKNVNELSGGERQKVAIARALAQESKIIFFDEPTSNLDIKNQLEVMKYIKKIAHEKNVLALVTMHDINLAIKYTDDFVCLKDGKLFKTGNINTINNDDIKNVFDIDVDIKEIDGEKIIIIKE